MNKKSYSFYLDTFINMLQMCPKLSGQKFVDPPFEEDILTFMRELGYPGNIKLLSDVKVDTLPQPWRTFGTIINKCLSGKVTGIDTLRLSRAQILWGLYHQETVDYVYLLCQRLKHAPKHFTGKRVDQAKAKVAKSRKEKHQLLIGNLSDSRNTLEVSDKRRWDDDDANIGKARLIMSQMMMIISDHDDDIERTDSDNDGDDFVHPKFSTYDDEARQEEEINEEDSFDLRVQTPSHVESTDDEDNDDEIQDANVEEEEMDEEATNKEEEGNELYRDVNVNLAGRDVEMTDAQQTNVQTTQVLEDTHVIITPVNPEGQQQSSSVSSGFVSNMLNPNPNSGIDSIFNLNTEATSLVDVPVTTLAEPPLLSVTTLPPPPTPLITHLLKDLEDNFSEFMQTNQFATPVSTIPGIVDQYLDNRINDAILPRIEKLVNDQPEAEVLTRSSTESKTSHAVAANLSELELKKILIDKMESNKSIYRSNE
ncbi:hypothetical protein Tco_1177695 [Tanacetum coccineum]